MQKGVPGAPLGAAWPARVSAVELARAGSSFRS